MTWDVKPSKDTGEILASLLSSSMPSLPPKEQRFGASTVRWWDATPGVAVIMADGGSVDDRTYAEQLVGIQLSTHGYRRATFNVESEGLQKTAGWPDIMEKAKRLIQSNQVTVLRNGYNNIVGHVVGDHGEYNVEIGRDDPNSQAITTWQCECPWDQYAWQRTRQWKKYEGRPCAHVMALYWKAKSTPLDDYDAEQHGAMPGQRLPAPAGPGGGGPAVMPNAIHAPVPGIPGPPHPPVGPGGDIIQGDQLPLGEGMGGPPGPAQAPLAPPSQPGVLPPFPGEEEEQMALWQGPGTTPGGGVSPPNAVSVPGAKPPTPFNPIQNPGGTYSKIAAQFTEGQSIALKNDVYAYPEGPYSQGHPMVNIPAGTRGQVLSVDETTGWIEAIFPLEGGIKTPQLAKAFLDPSDIRSSGQSDPFIRQH